LEEVYIYKSQLSVIVQMHPIVLQPLFSVLLEKSSKQ